MKHSTFILILVAIVLTACGPSTEQMTATAAVAQATATATELPTQTLAPTATSTPAPAPTETPAPQLAVIEVGGLSLDTLYQSEDLDVTFQYPSTWEVMNGSEMGGSANEIIIMEDY